MNDQASPRSSRKTLTVRGRGVASAEPDLVVLDFGITGRDQSYPVAVERLNERVEVLRGNLEGVGVVRTDLKTTHFDVDAEYHHEATTRERIFEGYRASHGLRLELAWDRELLNRVLKHVARSASEATLRVSFDVSDHKSLRRRAMQAAVEDAREAAWVLARSSGTELGDIEHIDYSFVEVRSKYFSYDYGGANVLASRSAAPDVEPESLEAEEGVTVVWSIS